MLTGKHNAAVWASAGGRCLHCTDICWAGKESWEWGQTGKKAGSVWPLQVSSLVPALKAFDLVPSACVRSLPMTSLPFSDLDRWQQRSRRWKLLLRDTQRGGDGEGVVGGFSAMDIANCNPWPSRTSTHFLTQPLCLSWTVTGEMLSFQLYLAWPDRRLSHTVMTRWSWDSQTAIKHTGYEIDY